MSDNWELKPWQGNLRERVLPRLTSLRAAERNTIQVVLLFFTSSSIVIDNIEINKHISSENISNIILDSENNQIPLI